MMRKSIRSWLHASGCMLLLAGGLFISPLSPAAIAVPEAQVATHGVHVTLGHGTLALEFVAPGVLHVHYLPAGKATPPDLVMNPAPSPSPPLAVHKSVDGETITFRSQRMIVTWNGHTDALQVDDADGHRLLGQVDFDALAQGRIILTHAADDALYGIGGFRANESVTAGLLRTDMQVARAGKQGHAGAPFVWSTAGWGVLVDCDGADFDLARGRIAVAGFKRPDADYYVLVGKPTELFAELARLSGPAPLFPKWAMGFTNSQWGIDEKELLAIVHTYRAKHIPIDNFTLDFDWKAWGQGNYGEFRWNPKKFPDGASGKLAKTLAAEGMHLSGIMKPRLLLDTAEGRYATQHDLWIPGEQAYTDYFSHRPTKELDFDKAATRKWFGRLAIQYAFDKGIVGWWNDEADVYGASGKLTSNTQFLNMERSLYDAQRAASKERVWSINRDFWLGAQRYAYGLWSGDIDTGFKSMAAQRVRMLSAIDVGEMEWGMDGGGFNGHPSDENYARWIEFGAFTPIFRVHGTLGEKRQPWRYGPVSEAAAVRAIRLRYALIPYIYSYQHTAHVAGVGLVRPLTFGWPHDAKVRDDVDAWMFGQWLLVSPVVKQGQTVKYIYLPPGKWTGWFNGKPYTGGQTIAYPVDAKSWQDIPLFIRSGAIIPTQPVMQYVGQHPVRMVTVEVFPSDHVTYFDYYDDDGNTYAYTHGAYFLQAMSVRRRGTTIGFELAAPQGSYRPPLQSYVLAIHGDAAGGVSVNGKALPQLSTPAALKAAGGAGWARGRDRYGAVTWVKVGAGAAAAIRVEGAAP